MGQLAKSRHTLGEGFLGFFLQNRFRNYSTDALTPLWPSRFFANSAPFCRIQDTFCVQSAKLQKLNILHRHEGTATIWPSRKQIWPLGQTSRPDPPKTTEKPEVGTSQGWLWAVSQTSVPAPKDKLFSIEMTRIFCLFFKAKHA